MGRRDLSELYRDFFGDLETYGKQTAGGESIFEEEKGKQSDGMLTAEDALAHANDALNEARRLFDGLEKSGMLPGGGAAGTAENPVSGEAMSGALNEKTAGKPTAEAAKEEEAAPAEPETDPLEDLDALIGLDDIKKDVRELAAFISIQQKRKEQGLKSVPVSLHLVFTGNPGTGKTTVARIIARLYKKIGVLEKGQLVEVDRSGLVAGYMGQTAIKTTEQIEKAMGGVLFVDEAYALAKKDDTFGEEAIDTILKAMEDNRDRFVVIVAGYTKPMEQFINSNPGLRSRFNKYIEFPDYTEEELYKIFEMNCRKYDYHLAEGTEEKIRAMIAAKKAENQEHFANAREVRNMFERIITNQAHRLSSLEEVTAEDMTLIAEADLAETADPAADAADSMKETTEKLTESLEAIKDMTGEKSE